VDYIVLAIPAFFVLIGVELVVARAQRRSVYRVSDSLADLGCGVIEQLFAVFLKAALFAGYLLVYERARLFEIPADAPIVWVLGLLGVDFFYYWFHRSSHEVGALWAAHVVHHSSEEYNLSVALRQSSFQMLFSWLFYLPLALVGLPPAVFVGLVAFNTLYQFWIHTRTIGRLGPLEWVFNTPSHHRVHHARNPEYIDRNHGGTFIVWDRLFGTFAREEQEPVYGITAPLRTWNPLWANFHYWAELFSKARRVTRWADRLRLFVKPPGWQPDELGGPQLPPAVDRATYRKFETPAPAGLSAYALTQFGLVLGGASALLFGEAHLSRLTLVAGALLVTLSTVSLTTLFERRRWAWRLELLRHAGAALAVLGLAWWAPGAFGAPPVAGTAVVAVALASAGAAAWLWRYRPLFERAAA
jgi:sterol desaturase/sphingolipid hydroxylase (fatty acid hydroxylase superfamily)